MNAARIIARIDIDSACEDGDTVEVVIYKETGTDSAPFMRFDTNAPALGDIAVALTEAEELLWEAGWAMSGGWKAENDSWTAEIARA